MSIVQIPTPHPVARIVIHALVVLVGGFAALGAAFFAYAAYQSVFRSLFFHGDVGRWMFGIESGIFVIGIGVATWLIMRRWPESLGTAVWLAVPTAVVLALVAVPAYPTTALAVGVGAALVLLADVVLLIRHRPWEQVLSITWIALLLLITVLTGTEV